MRIDGEPVWVEVPEDGDLRKEGVTDLKNGKNYIHCINNELKHNVSSITMAFVLISNDKFHGPIKRHLDGMGIVSQFMLFKNI